MPRPRIPFPTLCLVTDLAVVENDVTRLVDAVSDAVGGGVNMVQIRAPELSDSEFDGLVCSAAEVIGGRATTIINPSGRAPRLHRGIDGVQLSENASTNIADVRALYGKDALIGRSVHSVSAARDAAHSDADYLVLGTIFASKSHPGGAWHGSEIIRQVTSESELPIVGIGGITVENVGEVMRAGAHGIAVIRAILGADDPKAAALELRQTMDAAIRD